MLSWIQTVGLDWDTILTMRKHDLYHSLLKLQESKAEVLNQIRCELYVPYRRLDIRLVDGVWYSGSSVLNEDAIRILFGESHADLLLLSLDGQKVYTLLPEQPTWASEQAELSAVMAYYGFAPRGADDTYLDFSEVVAYEGDDPDNVGYGFYATWEWGGGCVDINIAVYGLEGWEGREVPEMYRNRAIKRGLDFLDALVVVGNGTTLDVTKNW